MERIIETKYGKVEGIEEDGLLKFRGIPFAKQPVGELAWKRAIEPDPWEGVKKAYAYGGVAPQFNNETWQGSLSDCLTINVIRKAKGSADEKLPVFVWIHGGGFSIGGCNDSLYAGDAFAQDGCVYVNFQYRLSVFGFYEFCNYPGCEAIETNRGLSDMIMGLKWVHENIARFGGDPENVTIAGESAGGTAVTTLLAVPSVHGLFKRAIAESSLCELVDTLESQRPKVELFLEGMGWDSNDNTLYEKLLQTEAYELVKGHLYQESNMQYRRPGTLGAGPIIDDLLPKRPVEALKDGASADVALIIGTNLHEGTMFVRPEATIMPNSWEQIEECFMQNNLSDRLCDFKQLYEEFEAEGTYGNAFVKFATDTGWEVPSIRLANAHSLWGETYMYRFEYLTEFTIESGMLATHAFELPCVFGVKEHEFSQIFFQGESEEAIDTAISSMHKPWISFTKEGRVDEDGAWARYDGTKNAPAVRIFDHNPHTAYLNRSRLMETWGDIIFYK